MPENQNLINTGREWNAGRWIFGSLAALFVLAVALPDKIPKRDIELFENETRQENVVEAKYIPSVPGSLDKNYGEVDLSLKSGNSAVLDIYGGKVYAARFYPTNTHFMVQDNYMDCGVCGARGNLHGLQRHYVDWGKAAQRQAMAQKIYHKAVGR